MIESILSKKEVKFKTKITIKSIIMVGLIILAVVLPMLVHLVAGSEGGMIWLPMYLPVVLGGLLLGSWWGLSIGIASPLFSFIITSLIGNSMPTLERLPFMIVELAVFAVVCGLFSKLVYKNTWFTPLAVVSSILAGRLVFLGLVAVFESVCSLTVSGAINQIILGYPGAIAIIVISFIVSLILKSSLNREGK